MALNEVSISREQPWLRAFPDPKDVFAVQDAYLAAHVYPLVSIELTQINPAWTGWIHLVCPYEPYDEVIGVTKFHNDYVGRNWMAFRLTHDNRYEFLGDRRYFVMECRDEADWYPVPADFHEARQKKGLPPMPDIQQRNQAYWLGETAKHYEAQTADYAAVRARTKELGYFTRWKDRPKPHAMVTLLGGTICEQNWCWTAKIPPAFTLNTSDRNDVHPVMANGDRFHLVADSGGVLKHCPEGCPTFFEPKSRTVLVTFDYT
jgi:hypothetical protein